MLMLLLLSLALPPDVWKHTNSTKKDSGPWNLDRLCLVEGTRQLLMAAESIPQRVAD